MQKTLFGQEHRIEGDSQDDAQATAAHLGCNGIWAASVYGRFFSGCAAWRGNGPLLLLRKSGWQERNAVPFCQLSSSIALTGLCQTTPTKRKTKVSVNKRKLEHADDGSNRYEDVEHPRWARVYSLASVGMTATVTTYHCHGTRHQNQHVPQERTCHCPLDCTLGIYADRLQ